MDFITDLPILNNYDFIWVMINPFIKMAYFIPLEINGKRINNFIRFFV